MHEPLKRHIQKQQTYQKILSVTYTEFSLKGLLAAKTSDIAQSAGIAHGTLFMHFQTREELLLRVIEEFGYTIGNRLQQLLNKEASLAEICSAHLAVIQEYEPFYAHLIRERTLLPKSIGNAIIMIQSGIAHYVEHAYNKAIHDNTIRPFPLHIVLNSWLGLIYYYLINRDIFSPGKSVIESHGQELLAHFMDMIKV